MSTERLLFYLHSGAASNYVYGFFFFFFLEILSALQAHGKLKPDHPLLIQIQELLQKLKADQKEIVSMRVPWYVGIRENEAADRAAKEALDKRHLPNIYIKFGGKNEMKLIWYLISFINSTETSWQTVILL